MSLAFQRAEQDAGLTYPLPDAPSPGTVKEVAAGVFWLRMPLPFALDHINLWLLADDEGWAIVDCGLGTEATRELWRSVIAAEFEQRPVRQVIVTHCHPDHIGLAAWLCARFDLLPSITYPEYVHAHAVFNRIGGTNLAALHALHRGHGLDARRLEAAKLREDHYRRGVPDLPTACRRIKDGDRVAAGNAEWRVITGHGHSPEHAALYSDALGVLISGDMLLPRISTNVSVWPMEPEADPVGDFLDSIHRFAELPENTLVLPSHGLPFYGAHERIAQLKEHHEQRLARLVGACAGPRTAAELMPEMFDRELDGHQIVFAMGETIAHLNHLKRRGELQRLDDTDGTYRFVRRPQR